MASLRRGNISPSLLLLTAKIRRIPKGLTMTKGYWVAHVDVSDPQTYENYKAANAVPFAQFGARFVIRGGDQEVREGTMRSRTVVIEFPSYEDAVACYNSAAYQAAKALRDPVSVGDLAIVRGHDD